LPEYVNTNPHGIVVYDDEGRRKRYPPGKFETDDSSVEDVNGVHSADSTEGREYEQLHPSEQSEARGSSLTDQIASGLSEARQAARRFLAVSNQVIVGDDEAPFGPETGTVTTKQAHIEGVPAGDPERVAFADHEAFPSEVEGKSVTDVAAQQAVDTEKVNQLAAEMVAEAQEGDARGPGAGGLLGQGPASEAGTSGRGARAEAILAEAKGESESEQAAEQPKRSRKQEKQDKQDKSEE
jgi:hypothetical protein